MRLSFIISLLTILSCSPRTTSTVYISELATIKNEQGQITAQGQIAVFEGKPTDMRVGLWKEFYENGTIKVEGQYKIGSYIQCCTGGSCRQFYFYRAGLWRYFDSTGVLKYELDFKPETLKINTSCEGGNKLVFGLIQSIPIKYRSKLTADNIYELQKISFVDDTFGEVTYTPLNRELRIEYRRK